MIEIMRPVRILGFAGSLRQGSYNRALLRAASELAPEGMLIETARVLPWEGLRPMLPSMMPRVGAGVQPRIFYNTGHGHLGWTLSAATADLVAEAIDARFRSVKQRRLH